MEINLREVTEYGNKDLVSFGKLVLMINYPSLWHCPNSCLSAFGEIVFTALAYTCLVPMAFPALVAYKIIVLVDLEEMDCVVYYC